MTSTSMAIRRPMGPLPARFAARPSVSIAACIVAGVWLSHGLFNKLMGVEPRHLAIVQAVPGLDGDAGIIVLTIVGIFEVALAVWILSKYAPYICAAAQTILLLSMNAAELTWAREHLLWPAGLVPVNLGFLALAWIAAIQTAPYRLRRHPIAIRAFFEQSLVLVYALPAHILRPLTPPGMSLATHNGFGFVAVAMVQTRGLRPAGLPAWMGQRFFLAGYRIFVKADCNGVTRRGLHILRSDTDSRLMMTAGNLLTHYRYRRCESHLETRDGRVAIKVRTPNGIADLEVVADLSSVAETLPPCSPFATLADAYRYAGPLPYTFESEPETNSIIAIKGVREHWSRRIVPVDVRRMTFFNSLSAFSGVRPILASAFYLRDVPYVWRRGVRHPLAGARRLT